MLAIWSLVPLPFLKPAWTSGSSRFSIAETGLENFEHYLASVWDDCNCTVVWAFFGIAFFGIGMKTDLFKSCGHSWVFQICRHIECSTSIASYFRIWNSSTGIPSLPLALFVGMLPKAHLTSHSRISGSRWVITPLWLSDYHKDLFCTVLLCILVYLMPLLGPYHFCPLSNPSLHEMFPWYL